MAKSYLESLLGEREKIQYTTHQHWFILASTIAAEIALIIGLLVLTIIAANALEFKALIVVIGFLLMLLPVATMTRDILNYTNRMYIVTNRRVMQISGIINKNVTDSSLEKVNDVKMSQSFLGRIFNYGDVEILTASELGVNLFRRIHDPVRFKTAMLNAKEMLEREALPPVSSQAMPDIPTQIAQLDELRQKGILTEEEFAQKKAELLARL